MTRRKQLESLAALLLLFVLIGRWQRSWYYVYVGGLLVLLGLIWPAAAQWMSFAWMKLGKAIGAVTSRVLLTVVFVLIVLPVSFYVRWKDKLDIRRRPGRSTTFKDRDHTYLPADLQDPW